MSMSIQQLLHRTGRVRQLIERERNRSATAFRIMRLNAHLLKLQQRLLMLVDARALSSQPVPIAVPASRRFLSR